MGKLHLRSWYTKYISNPCHLGWNGWTSQLFDEDVAQKENNNDIKVCIQTQSCSLNVAPLLGEHGSAAASTVF